MSQDQLRQEWQKFGFQNFQNVQVVRAAYVVNTTTPSGELVAMTISPVASRGGSAAIRNASVPECGRREPFCAKAPQPKAAGRIWSRGRRAPVVWVARRDAGAAGTPL